MKVNKQLMAAARFERQQICELTVAQFRTVMQDCFDADRFEMERRKIESDNFQIAMRNHYTYGTPMPQQLCANQK